MVGGCCSVALNLTSLPAVSLDATVKEPEKKEDPADKPKGTKPKFEKRLTAQVAEDGTSVRFDCKVSGDPEPEIKW